MGSLSLLWNGGPVKDSGRSIPAHHAHGLFFAQRLRVAVGSHEGLHTGVPDRRPFKLRQENGLDYLPGAFPGFSWQNLMKTRGKEAKFNQIPRAGGQFLWSQAVASKRAGAKMLYIAMFDEIDEATAIFKVSNDPPTGETPFLTYESLPSDHYMWLTGQIAKMLRGEIPATDEMPKR